MTTTHTAFPATPAEHGSKHQEPAQRAIISWGLPRDISPHFGARLIQSRYRLDFLSDRASLIGEWSETQIDKLDQAFPEIIKTLETKLLTGELDAQRQHCITIQHGGFTCEADTLGSYGYVYVAIYRATGADTMPSAMA
ncbi:type IV toxin-antitoxin system YeeU family antitoxin [Aeromonas sp. sif2416]|uniref:type IV toxin-antitoxin system YeeU family antitoxin n=1 Tax=Aeromonas sp. sif2416 TaxID=2854793 RepID=UPI001C469586|nr:type IV toxin-antitoxin system YeeU family antitoxin [Aeromonas sp. sif2416]MBV7437059.1 type IV toxin-antitoxin system YeeU family antitoxin [Aeromonas sp. sif2416]